MAKHKRYTPEQITRVLKQQEAGMKVAERRKTITRFGRDYSAHPWASPCGPHSLCSCVPIRSRRIGRTLRTSGSQGLLTRPLR
jgi:hypothetical protein